MNQSHDAARTDRRGMQLAALIVVLLVMVGIGAGLMNLAQQAGRSGHWFEHGQIAHDLADAALKSAYVAMTRANSRGAAESSPALKALFAAVAEGKTGSEVTLVESGPGASPLVTSLVERFEAFAPRVKVTAKVTGWQPLTGGGAIPFLPGEASGSVLITSRASVKTPVGVAIERTLALEKQFKLVSPVAPLLGRFGLFVERRGTEELDRVPMRFDPETGDAQASGARPLVLESGARAPIVAAGTPTLDRAAFVSALARDAAFLDAQGWVYLGGGAGERWVLSLAHGFSDLGETPLLPGTPPDKPQLFRGTASEHEDFLQRFKQKTKELAPGAPFFPDLGRADDPRTPLLGFYPLLHGFADNYELISLDPALHERVAPGGARAANMDFGPGLTSVLRLFGTPDALSPTLVFGPVYRRVLRRVSLLSAFEAVGEFAAGGVYVVESLQLYRLAGLPPPQKEILEHALQGDEPRFGTRVLDAEPFVESLATVLSAVGSGDYTALGTLAATAAPSAGSPGPVFTSATGLANVPTDGWPTAAARTALLRGECNAPGVYSGLLASGFAELIAHLKAKTTYEVRGGLTSRMLAGKVLKVPGVVVLRGAGTLSLPEIEKVEGGILITDGPLAINGNIARGSADEPLTLIAHGDIVIGSGVSKIDAVLVSLTGTVRWPSGDITVTGGVACQTLDVSGLATSGRKRIVFSRDADPSGPNRDKVRVYYGGADRVVVSGVSP